jgi:hypothetical protein
VTSTTIETTTPTYSWTTAIGAVSSVLGLITMVVCIYASVSHRTEAGFAPIPNGLAALACAMTLGGLVLVLFRILHADREEMMLRLEVMDEKLNNVWGIAAKTSIEAKPVREQKHTQRRGRRRKQSGGEPVGDNVLPLRSRRAADALRRLTEQIKGDQDA